jgi:hypothetical protein
MAQAAARVQEIQTLEVRTPDARNPTATSKVGQDVRGLSLNLSSEHAARASSGRSQLEIIETTVLFNRK